MTRFKTHCCGFEFWGKNHSPFVEVPINKQVFLGIEGTKGQQCRNCNTVRTEVVFELGDNKNHSALYNYAHIEDKNE